MAKASHDKPTDGKAPEEARPSGGAGGKRKLPMIGAGVLVLVLGVAAGAWFSGLLDGSSGGAEAAEAGHAEEATHAAPTFYALPEILVSLNTAERRSTFLKVKLSLELASPDDQARIERLLPRIVDYCHVYLRELRIEEARGSAGSARLREELLRRIAAAVAPVPVRDVLFDELFVQ